MAEIADKLSPPSPVPKNLDDKDDEELKDD